MLQEYQKTVSTIHRESDFYEFWKNQLEKLKQKPLIVNLGEVIIKENITRKSFYYNSIDDNIIAGNLFIPKNYDSSLPIIVCYHGLGANTYGDDYFKAMEKTWLSKGFLVIGFDVRGQNGKTDYDLEEKFHEYGLYCRNILDKENFYFVKTYLDAVRLLDVVQFLPETKDKKIICNGGSQGGALTLAVCSLDSRPILAFADIPSNSDVRYMVKESSGGFNAINKLITDKPELERDILKTLSYIDTCNLVSMIKVPILCAVGSLDRICPPEGFYQAYRQINTKKSLEIYENFGHGGFDEENFPKKLEFLKNNL